MRLTQYKDQSTSGRTVVLSFMTGLGFLFSIIIGITFWTQSNLSFYVSYFSDKAVEVEYWTSFWITVGATIIFGISLPVNFIASIIRLFL